MSTTSMFGKTYTTIGSSDSNFLIKTKGDFKIQWGGKFIDVIKDGKIASGNSNFFNNVSSKEDISEEEALKLLELRPVSFDYKNGQSTETSNQLLCNNHSLKRMIKIENV